MSLHIFANIVTDFGTAANNRAETEGNITTLQKLIWHEQSHTTVSAEAIRFSIRRLLSNIEKSGTNRRWNEDSRANEWEDHGFKGWNTNDGKTFIDDDLLGFMTAEAAKEEGAKASANVRRAVLEVTRAVSLTPWHGDVTFNAASPNATPSAAKGDDASKNPVPYGTEVHATRYQFGLAMTPERLREPDRATKALQAVGSLRTVAGNHGRFFYDFAPDAIVIRITDDPAPRILYCFDTDDGGKTVSADAIVQRIDSGDLSAKELILGVGNLNSPLAEQLKKAGVKVSGVKAAIETACSQINKKLNGKG